MLRNTLDSYGNISKFFHWTIAFFIILMLILGFSFSLFEKNFVLTAITFHKSLGFSLFFLMILRLLWRFFNPSPPLPITEKKWVKNLAKCVEFLLYLSIFIMILDGIALSYTHGHPINFWWWFQINLPIQQNHHIGELTSQIHLIFAWVIITLIALHVLGAFRHYFWIKDKVLQRMLPFQK